MDRNLGATQVATSITDVNAYGDLYQWGRGADGHQSKTSATTSTLSGSDAPGHGNFILVSNLPFDWRSPQNANLWQGVSGVNNPCPSGYRLPTEAEWEAERLSWNTNNAAGAFASPLKLSYAGGRNTSDGMILTSGINGGYWSSNLSDIKGRGLSFYSAGAFMGNFDRGYGQSVRCIKN